MEFILCPRMPESDKLCRWILWANKAFVPKENLDLMEHSWDNESFPVNEIKMSVKLLEGCPLSQSSTSNYKCFKWIQTGEILLPLSTIPYEPRRLHFFFKKLKRSLALGMGSSELVGNFGFGCKDLNIYMLGWVQQSSWRELFSIWWKAELRLLRDQTWSNVFSGFRWAIWNRYVITAKNGLENLIFWLSAVISWNMFIELNQSMVVRQAF